jgi:RNA polymerase sigma factor (sigma-70 family)
VILQGAATGKIMIHENFLYMSAAGDNRDAFEKRYYVLLRPLTYWAMKQIWDHTRDLAVGNQIVNDVFLDFYAKGKDFNSPEIVGLLYVRVKKRCIDYHRKQQRLYKRKSKWLDDPASQPAAHQATQDHSDEEAFYMTEWLRLLREAIDNLPPKMRAYILDDLDGMSAEEIAEKHQVSKQTIQNTQSKGKSRIRDLLNIKK